MKHSNKFSRRHPSRSSLTRGTSAVSAVLFRNSYVAIAEKVLLENPNSALSNLRAHVAIDYIEATGMLPTTERVFEFMRVHLANEPADPIALEATAELVAEILTQIRIDEATKTAV